MLAGLRPTTSDVCKFHGSDSAYAWGELCRRARILQSPPVVLLSLVLRTDHAQILEGEG